jgi:hypothetical protein
MNTEHWTIFYEVALDDGMDLFEAARFADAALRDYVADGIDAAEYLLEDR